MKVFSGSHAARAGSAALLGAALLALPTLPGGTAAAQETTADKCAETLKENYGVTGTGDVNQQDGSTRSSVYAEGTTASGKTVRFRCLHEGRETPEVQVYAEPEPGGPRDWASWGPADDYKVEAEPEAEPEAEADGAQPSETEQSGQPGQPAEPEQEAQPDQPEQESEQAEQESEQEAESEEAPGPKRATPPEDDAS